MKKYTKNKLIWDKNYTLATFVFVIIFSLAFVSLMSAQMVAPIWIVITILTIVWYFITLTQYSVRWQKYNSATFGKKLFWHSFGYRLVFGLGLAYVSTLTWDNPVYVGAVDANSYHNLANAVANRLWEFDFEAAYMAADIFDGIDNTGPSLLYGLLYMFTGGSYISSVIFGALLGAIGVLYLYKTAQIIWGESIARLSGLLYMHFPLALFYSTVTLKEGFVAFVIIMVVYIMTRIINNRSISLQHYIVLVTLMSLVFLFRTPVGLGIVVLVTAAFLLNRYRGSYAGSIFIGLASIGLFFMFMVWIGEIDYFLERADEATFVGQQRTAVLIGEGDIQVFGISILDLAITPIYIFLSVIAPFPALVEIGTTYGTPFDQNYINSPGRLVWNILAYFSIIGFWYAIKEKLFNSMMVTGFSVGYLYILISTVTLTRERFAYLGMPLLLILAAIGIHNTRSRLLWYLYLGGLIMAVILWNILRTGVRA